MKNQYTLFLIFLALSFSKAQVYVNVTDPLKQEPSASFQVESTNSHKGIGMPTIQLINTTDYSMITAEPKEGLLVYNNMVNEFVEQGYYFWSLSPSPHWEKMNGTKEISTILQNINTSVLGYTPTIIGNETPASASFNTAIASRQTCVKWEVKDGGNDNIYCTYQANQALDFEKAYNLSKNAGGYVVTITSTDEWNFVKSKLVDATPTPIWIGYTAIRTPGNIYKYRWITNESWRNNWADLSSTQSNFDPDKILTMPIIPAPLSDVYPNCSYIQSSASDSNRLWAQGNCATVPNINTLIIEFVTNNESF